MQGHPACGLISRFILSTKLASFMTTFMALSQKLTCIISSLRWQQNIVSPIPWWKVILQTGSKDRPRTQIRQCYEHTFLSIRFLPLRSRNLLGVLLMASFFHLVPRSVGKMHHSTVQKMNNPQSTSNSKTFITLATTAMSAASPHTTSDQCSRSILLWICVTWHVLASLTDYIAPRTSKLIRRDSTAAASS